MYTIYYSKKWMKYSIRSSPTPICTLTLQISSLLNQTQLMMSIMLIRKAPNEWKQTYANIKPKCVKTIQKMGSVRTSINANLLMDTINYLRHRLCLENPIEQRNANRSGRREFAVMGLDVNSRITNPKNPSKHSFYTWCQNLSMMLVKGQRAECSKFWTQKHNEDET